MLPSVTWPLTYVGRVLPASQLHGLPLSQATPALMAQCAAQGQPSCNNSAASKYPRLIARMGSLSTLVMVCVRACSVRAAKAQIQDELERAQVSSAWSHSRATVAGICGSLLISVCVCRACVLFVHQTCIARVEAEFAAAREAEREGCPVESSVEAASAAVQAEAAAFSPATSNICFVYACTKIKSNDDPSQASGSSS